MIKIKHENKSIATYPHVHEKMLKNKSKAKQIYTLEGEKVMNGVDGCNIRCFSQFLASTMKPRVISVQRRCKVLQPV